MNVTEILYPVLIFAGMGALLGALLAVAAKIFEVKTDPRADEIAEVLPGANCGGCGKTGCAALAAAIAAGEAPANACIVGGAAVAEKVGRIMGVAVEAPVRCRAQVMCSGGGGHAKLKYTYSGPTDCIAAERLGGGDKVCPNGCIGLGTCAAACPFGAIAIVDGAAVVDYHKCEGCGVCVRSCPKGIIKLIPYDSAHWVGCATKLRGAQVRHFCDAGCISCRLCERSCPSGAIKVDGAGASIDYAKCTECGLCEDKCPRHIIWSAVRRDGELVMSRGKKADATAEGK